MHLEIEKKKKKKQWVKRGNICKYTLNSQKGHRLLGDSDLLSLIFKSVSIRAH